MLTPQELTRLLKERGMKITPQRLEVYGAFSGAEEHPTATEIYERVKARMPTLSFATIYQALNFFCRQGLLQTVDVGDGAMRYDVDTHPHAHFRCERCGQVMNLDYAYHHHLDQDVAQKTGFLIHHHQTLFLGICRDCQKNKGV
ncbi:Fur family transcriptional regulator [Acidaminococcus timonensis]|uniref:Fur family transcriptional regulator n=2 Tax=Acidaminococcus TaxID=904 RepID=UPI0030780832